ncbi:hypothetical protein Deiofobo_0473 [Pseudomonas phage Deifobo]|nr:hypothetical protein Deiofobo_0473 [Pseudomonas phage Deifobo]
MKTIFYTNPIDETRVAKLITDKSTEELYTLGIFNENTQYVIYDKIPDTLEQQFFDSLKFDKIQNPTKVVIDLDSAANKTLKNIRTERNMVLASLDREAVKYITNPDILSIIEKDKDILRDLPEKIDFSKIKKAQDLLKIEFPELSVNYEKKYNDLRKKQREKKAT